MLAANYGNPGILSTPHRPPNPRHSFEDAGFLFGERLTSIEIHYPGGRFGGI
jgi:hypothetical protein